MLTSRKPALSLLECARNLGKESDRKEKGDDVQDENGRRRRDKADRQTDGA